MKTEDEWRAELNAANEAWHEQEDELQSLRSRLDAGELSREIDHGHGTLGKGCDYRVVEAMLQSRLRVAQTANGRLDRLMHILRNAERIGKETDIPEGSRYIQLSDTLVTQMLTDTLPNGAMASGSIRVVERGSLIDERCAKCGRELLEPVERKPGTDGTICCGCALKD